MAEVSAEKRFRGSVRLVTLHLWRVGKSTDVEDGFAAARHYKMLKPKDEQFVRKCLALDAQLEAGEQPSEPITVELAQELQLCAILLNSADPLLIQFQSEALPVMQNIAREMDSNQKSLSCSCVGKRGFFDG